MDLVQMSVFVFVVVVVSLMDEGNPIQKKTYHYLVLIKKKPFLYC